LDVIKDVGKNLKYLLKGKPYKKDDYKELLVMLFTIFKMMKTKGLLTLEAHIENPHESEIFKKFPKIISDHHAIDFLCTYLRLLIMGVDNHYALDDLMDKNIDTHHHKHLNAAHAVGAFGESLPALGIVAAVLGVITTMKSITEPPEILGGLIAAALVGTFTGILLSYGVITPMSVYMTKFADSQSKYFECIKAGILAYMQGNAPAIVVEFVRNIIPDSEKPDFKEIEEALNGNESAQ
jgi:chemotaxis protein MotA